MNYLKKYKKKESKIKVRYIFEIIVAIFIIYIIWVNIDSKTESNVTEQINIEEIIQNTSENVVGILKNDISGNTIWGSGVVVSKKGYILTNEHIVGGKNENCYVYVDNNKKIKAKVIWSDNQIDLAILKVKHEFEKCEVLGNSKNLRLGQKVYSIGNPVSISFSRSVTEGIIGGLNRSLEFEENGQKMYLNNLIQTDATINSGSSGGALIDINGNLIGINTIKISSVESMNFAVPIDIVIPILKILEKENKIEEVQLGIWGYDKYSIAEIDSNANLKEGIYVTNVEQNSISELAGIKSGDIILSIEEEKVGTLMDFKVKIYEKMYKKSIILKIKRAQKEYLIEVKF